jgi:hypothetical protein
VSALSYHAAFPASLSFEVTRRLVMSACPVMLRDSLSCQLVLSCKEKACHISLSCHGKRQLVLSAFLSCKETACPVSLFWKLSSSSLSGQFFLSEFCCKLLMSALSCQVKRQLVLLAVYWRTSPVTLLVSLGLPGQRKLVLLALHWRIVLSPYLSIVNILLLACSVSCRDCSAKDD